MEGKSSCLGCDFGDRDKDLPEEGGLAVGRREVGMGMGDKHIEFGDRDGDSLVDNNPVDNSSSKDWGGLT